MQKLIVFLLAILVCVFSAGSEDGLSHQIGYHQIGYHQRRAHQIGYHQIGYHQLRSHQIGYHQNDEWAFD